MTQHRAQLRAPWAPPRTAWPSWRETKAQGAHATAQRHGGEAGGGVRAVGQRGRGEAVQAKEQGEAGSSGEPATDGFEQS